MFLNMVSEKISSNDVPCTALNPLTEFPRPSTVVTATPSSEPMGQRQELMLFVCTTPALRGMHEDMVYISLLHYIMHVL